MPYTEWINGEPVERLTPEEREVKKAEAKQAKLNKKKRKPGEVPKYVKGRKEGMDLEKRVANQWNKDDKQKKTYNVKQRIDLDAILGDEEEESPQPAAPLNPAHFKPPLRSSINTGFDTKATRQPNSGAMWHAKGDITLSHALMEVKERGTTNARGEKQITIPKEWLTKQADEAFQERRDFWYLAFAYKNDDAVYIIKPYDHEIELVKRIEQLEHELNQLRQEGP